MKSEPVGGVVAEYNPFHNGHLRLLAEVRRNMPEAPVAVVLSSNFTQRGMPAVADKWTRAKMALTSGADLVLELPFIFSCNAAPEFAAGAIDILARTNFVTHLCFGVEDLNFDANAILNILIQESDSFKRRLKKNLSLGQSYPKSIALALEVETPGSARYLSSPNNSLGLSYLLHVKRKGYPLHPLPIERKGAGYHDLTLEALPSFPSATSVRAALARNESDDALAGAVPPSVLALLRQTRESGRLCLGTAKLWTLLQGLLLRSSPSDLRCVAGMDEGLENLFLRHQGAESYQEFIGRCVCARYTRGRLQRQAARLLVGFGRWEAAAFSRLGPPYIRVLGFNEKGRKILRERGKDASLPLISRLPAAYKAGPTARAAAEMEFRASRLYELLLEAPDFEREARATPSVSSSD